MAFECMLGCKCLAVNEIDWDCRVEMLAGS